MLAIAAPAAFRWSPNSTAAADIVGAMLTPWHYLSIAAPLALVIIERRRQRSWAMIVVVAAVFLASLQAVVDLRIRAIRSGSFVPISSLPRDSAVRRQFGLLHGVSSLLLVAQVLTAGIVVAYGDKE